MPTHTANPCARNYRLHELRMEFILLYSVLTNGYATVAVLQAHMPLNTESQLKHHTKQQTKFPGLPLWQESSRNVSCLKGEFGYWTRSQPIIALCFPNYRRPHSNRIKPCREDSRAKTHQRHSGHPLNHRDCSISPAHRQPDCSFFQFVHWFRSQFTHIASKPYSFSCPKQKS